MKLTAFQLATKVEEAIRNYFANSFVFSSRKIDVERCMDFRKRNASIQFFLKDGDERVPMGGMEFTAIQERDNKMAVQCRYNIQPTDVSEQFFIILRSDAEQYSQYLGLSDIMRKQWEKNIDAYLPKNEEPPPIAQTEQPQSLDDEYDSLSPEEIEAITGVRPEPKETRAAPTRTAEKDSAEEQPSDAASEEEIQRLMGMMMDSGSAEKPEASAPEIMSMEEIEALARDVQKQSDDSALPDTSPESAPPETESPTSAPAEEKPAEIKKPKKPAPKDDGPVEDISVDDIWKQITGGK